MPFTVFTDKEYHFNYFPTHTQAAKFSIKVKEQAYIALSDDPHDVPPLVIRIGEESGVYKKNQLIARAAKQIPLKESGFTHIWITWYNQKIKVGLESSLAPIIKCEEKEVKGDFFGVSTYEQKGEWSIDDRWGGWLNDPRSTKAGWLHEVKGQLPDGATIGGYDGLTELYYVGRAFEGSRHYPGKLRKDTNEIEYIGDDLQPKKAQDYELLVGGNMLSWEVASDGEVPPTAVNGGVTSKGETIHIGRAPSEFAVEMGSILKSEKALLVSQGGKVKRITTYEVCCVDEESLPD